MKLRTILGWSSALCLSARVLQAQETSEVDQIRKQLQQANEAFQKAVEEHRQIIDALNKRLEAIQPKQAGALAAAQQHTNKPPPSAAAVEQTSAPAGTPPAGRPWSPADPIRLAGGAQNYINVSFDTLLAAGWSTAKDIESLQQGDHDPKQRGFTLQGIELTLDGKVDPYLRGQGNLVLKLSPKGETEIEVEEAFLETVALPANLQFKAGQFFTDFGRINIQHAHTWDFVDSPAVLTRFLGPDGLRNPGARLSWLTPTPFYSELFLTVQNSQGETAHSFRNDNDGEPFFGRTVTQGRVKSPTDLLFVPRYVASFNLSDSQTLVAGASAAFGPNATGGATQIYGVDLFWKWKSPHHHAGFPFVSWQTEGMWRRFEAHAFAGDAAATPLIPPLPHETLNDYGLYSQISYGFKKGWVVSLRGDYVAPDGKGKYESLTGLDPERDLRWRISPAITYYPSEFSKIRLQYNYDDRAHLGVDHSVWIQFEFLLGSHAAHKF